MNQSRLKYRRELRDAVRRLRDAFRPYAMARPVRLAHSDDRNHGRIRNAHDVSPRLEEDERTFYVCRAMYESGSVEETKRYLPLVFGHLARSPTEDFVECGLFSKLRELAWYEWPAPEKAAIVAYFSALWPVRLSVCNHQNILSTEPLIVWPIDVTLAGIAQVFDNLSPFLEAWNRMCEEMPAARMRMLEFIQAEEARMEQGRPSLHSWWKRREAQGRQVVDWLVSSDHLQIVQRAYEDIGFVRPDDKRRIEQAIGEFALHCRARHRKRARGDPRREWQSQN